MIANSFKPVVIRTAIAGILTLPPLFLMPEVKLGNFYCIVLFSFNYLFFYIKDVSTEINDRLKILDAFLPGDSEIDCPDLSIPLDDLTVDYTKPKV
jgi:hypothetical protein